MSDKQVKVAKPEKTKPQPVKPQPTKPITVKPAKAEASGPHSHTNCTRCNVALGKDSGVVRALCSSCDFLMQDMHYCAEWVVLGKVYYMSERAANKFRIKIGDDGKLVHKPFRPRRRDFFQPPVNQAATL